MRRPDVRRRLFALALLAGGLATAASDTARASADSEPFASMPYALWRVVHYLCAPTHAIGLTTPCEDVKYEGTGGYAILAVNSNHILTVPTTRITGIESRVLLRPGQPNYWQAAWAAQSYLKAARRAPLPRDMAGLALNSADGRSQEQLHIHTGCVFPFVLSTLAGLRLKPEDGWRPLSSRLPGGRYRVRAVLGADLTHIDVFGLLEPSLRADEDAMSQQTIAVAGAIIGGQPGFYVLNASSANGMDAHAEGLLDFTCAIAKMR
jgi:CDP-diacylglycerol pyrophosphatase